MSYLQHEDFTRKLREIANLAGSLADEYPDIASDINYVLFSDKLCQLSAMTLLHTDEMIKDLRDYYKEVLHGRDEVREDGIELVGICPDGSDLLLNPSEIVWSHGLIKHDTLRRILAVKLPDRMF